MNQLWLDRLFALAVLALALGLIGVSLSYDAATALFPRALCALLVVLAVLQLVRGSTAENGAPSLHSLVYAALLLGLVLGWMGVVRVVNIELGTLVMTLLSLRLLGMHNWLWNWNVAAGLMLLIHLLFFRLLDVARPASWWF